MAIYFFQLVYIVLDSLFSQSVLFGCAYFFLQGTFNSFRYRALEARVVCVVHFAILGPIMSGSFLHPRIPLNIRAAP